MSLLFAQSVTKTYRVGDIDVPAIKGVDFAIEPASFVAFVGPSGSGKTTLLNMIGCLDHPTGGALAARPHRRRRQDRPPVGRGQIVIPQLPARVKRMFVLMLRSLSMADASFFRVLRLLENHIHGTRHD
jgi:ABC-type Fe3+/spermidine/putrescine transport system ATPase subunit